jgi:hypothetical protein
LQVFLATVAKVIEDGDAAAGAGKEIDKMRANETGAARHKDARVTSCNSHEARKEHSRRPSKLASDGLG